jgi:predicted transposase/invertase (TIGR01784 family)
MPVIFVGMLNENLFSSSRYVTHHLLLDTESHEQSLKLSEFYFIELKKFTKTAEQLETTFEKWLYFFKHAETLDHVPKNLKEPELREAFDLMAEVNWSDAERAFYEKIINEERVQSAREEWLIEKEKCFIAKRLLQTMTDREVADITGLELSLIQELRKN